MRARRCSRAHSARMPPPPTPPAAPAPLEDGAEEPKVSPEEALASMLGMRPKPEDPRLEVLMDRSASITYDPKMKEIKGMLHSHTSQASPTSSAPSSSSGSNSAGRSHLLRTGGCGLVDRRMKELEHSPQTSLVDDRPGLEQLQSSLGASRPSSSSGSGAAPAASGKGDVLRRVPMEEEEAVKEAAKVRMDRFDMSSSRHRYRDYTDKSLKRLLIDMDLARDPDRVKHYSHQMRCDHLDKMHSWYKNYTLKEDVKKTYSPPYLRFSNEGPVSPGSMRVQFKQPSPLLATLARSDSSPASLTS